MTQRILFIIKNLYTMERLGVMQMSALARKQNWDTDLLISDEHDSAQIKEKIASFQPAILAFSAMSPEYPSLEHLARLLRKQTDSFILFGGPHPTFFQEIIHEPFIDAIAFGEGDYSFPMFLERFASGGDYTGTPGMHFNVNGRIVNNPPAPLIEDLDHLPFPDRSLMVRGNPLLEHNRSHIFFASRGCPNSCTYCFNHKYNKMFRSCGRILRRRSVDNLISEIEQCRRDFGTEFAYIDDDIFTLCPLEWLEEFAREFPRRVGIPFMCNVHVNFVNEEKVKLLKAGGCQVVCFGIECGDADVSRHLLKRNILNESIISLAEILHRYDIRFMTQNLMALPVEHPLGVDLATLDLNIRCRPTYAVAHLFYPLPGTDLERYSREHDYYDNQHDLLPERTNSFSALTFPDPREKIRVQRLHKLFGLVVSFPFLRPLVPLLIRLPLGFIYSFLFVAWYGYSMRFRLEKTSKSGKELQFFLRSLRRSFSSFWRKPARVKTHDSP